jgi:hypothetical protein
MSVSRLKKIVEQEVRRTLNEDYARGIPDFALSTVAKDTADEMRRHLLNHINQVTQNPSDRRTRMTAAASVLKDLETEVKALLEDKLSDFLRQT